jgi:hypothetical protein
MKYFRDLPNGYYFGRCVVALAFLLLLGGCGGGGSSGSGSAGVGPKGYGTCTISSGAAVTQCVSYTGQFYQTGISALSAGCTGTGFTFTAGPAACSLANSVGTCTYNPGASFSIDVTAATTLYSAAGYTASVAQSSCVSGGGTYTNP